MSGIYPADRPPLFAAVGVMAVVSAIRGVLSATTYLALLAAPPVGAAGVTHYLGDGTAHPAELTERRP
ncbi:MAG: hypothetical protein ABEJ05_10990 [Haloglomus sp.]